jgi:hypothetical protein
MLNYFYQFNARLIETNVLMSDFYKPIDILNAYDTLIPDERDSKQPTGDEDENNADKTACRRSRLFL